MGLEYYLVKPCKKEIFYLGKHMNCPEGIAERTYRDKPEWIDYDCYDDFFWDFLRENYEEFLQTELNLERLRDVIFSIYSWCIDDKVYFDNDCNDNAEWINWKETGSLSDVLRKAHIIQDINSLNKGVDATSEELAKYLFNGDIEQGKLLLKLINEGSIDKIETIMPEDISWVDE